jgi:redox-sensitive bicupin YhaK (pirin superfamily)
MPSIVHTLHGHTKDLGGGMLVQRMLPAAQQRSVGPFVFFDHFGPVTVHPSDQHDVRPHPHIGLATVTYLFEGAMQHHDSLGFNQLIEPGAINLMVAGRGIVHSERRPPHLAQATYVNHGLQLWLALPRAHEEDEPSFSHTPASAIPELTRGDARVRVLMGAVLGARSPVPTFGSTLYLDVQLAPQGHWTLQEGAQELAVYPVDAPLWIDGERIAPRHMAVLKTGQSISLEARDSEHMQGARLVVLGGDALDAPRHMWWNFVSSRKERIVQAASDWQAQTMGQIEGESEFIPLPEPGPNAVR